ncbi:MAG TPA: RNA-protein complex protein Nop10 [Euryarchaeota archaeon]|nr:MAG: RNA-protein complex protein Nop10 [Thermoplasmata archaeon]HHD15515.1 RNA-protein complex protein Nop10 [Euryarchaeota archaeon]
MISRIKVCSGCGRYTLSETCPSCGAATGNTIPPRYSPDDRFGKYRRMALYGSRNKE